MDEFWGSLAVPLWAIGLHAIMYLSSKLPKKILIFNFDGKPNVYKGKFEESVDVVVKVLPLLNESDLARAESIVHLKRKLQEPKIHHSLDPGHNNIVRYYCNETLLYDGRQYLAIATEYCQWNLVQFLGQDVLPPNFDYVNACKQLLSGLQYLHNNGILHRNLEVGSILVTENRTGFVFKISDFGFSKQCESFAYDNNFDKESHHSAPLDRQDSRQHLIAPEVYANRDSPDQITFGFKADIFAMALLFVFIKSKGTGHLYASQDDIKRENPNETLLVDSKPFRSLILDMTNSYSTNRPSAAECLDYPIFWDCQKTLRFFISASDLMKDHNSLKQNIEARKNSVLGQGNWRDHLTPEVAGYIFPQNRRGNTRRRYVDTSLVSLLRAIRNLHGHYNDNDTPVSVRTEIGGRHEEFLKYWVEKFPELFVQVYEVCQSSRPEIRHCMQEFY